MKTTFHACGFMVAIATGLACSRPQDPAQSTQVATSGTPSSLDSRSVTEKPALNPQELLGSSADDSTLVATVEPKNDADDPQSNDTTFRIMSWNLEWFYDDDPNDNYSKLAKEQTAPNRAKWDWKRDGVAKAIHQVSPSVAAFQEIENRRVLWYLGRALSRNHNVGYREICVEGDDVFTEQDVGFIYRSGDVADKKALLQIEPLLSATFGRSAAMRRDEGTAEVSKHLMVEYEVSFGETTEIVSILTLHLRAREEAVQTRIKQARTIHAWLAEKIRDGQNVIVLGDVNTEEITIPALPGTDMAAICGFDTPDQGDDLVDLHIHLPAKERQTHLLPGKAFDRILVSPSMLEDAPDRIDLAFTQIERLKSLSINGNSDVPDEHWNNYWNIDDANRDLSDHWPIMATFEFK